MAYTHTESFQYLTLLGLLSMLDTILTSVNTIPALLSFTWSQNTHE